MKLVGGGLCFDFANTVGGRVPAESGRGKRAFAVVRDKLSGYADLVTWGRRVGLLTGTEARRLLRAAEGRPDEAAAALARGVAMREAAFHIFRAIVDGRPRAGSRAAPDRFRESAGTLVAPLFLLGCSLWLGLATPLPLRDAWTATSRALFPLP